MLIRQCAVDAPPFVALEVQAFDPATGTVELLSSLGSSFFPRNTVSWALEQHRGISAEDGDIVARIAWLDATGATPVDVRVGQGKRSFSLYDPGKRLSCAKGRARSPAFSPDHSRVAVITSAPPLSADGFDCLREPWGISIFTVGSSHARTLAVGFQDASDLAWAPNGKSLAFSTLGDVYLLDVDSKRLVRLTGTETIGALSFGPDGQSIYGIKFDQVSNNPRNELVRLDVAAIVRERTG